MEVKIVRSCRRRRTVSARLIQDYLLVRVPARLSSEELSPIISQLTEKFEKKKIKEELTRRAPLSEIAQRLNVKYFYGRLTINSIEYVTDQNCKHGCCNYATGHIRISHKVGFMPSWVRDYVLIHEMAHLIEPNHSLFFWKIVSRYPFAERARGYLIAVGMGCERMRVEELEISRSDCLTNEDTVVK